MNLSTIPDTSDRRRFFRIQDDVALRFNTVSHEQLEAALQQVQNGYPDTINLASSFATISARLHQSLDRVRRELPDVATLLEGLNEKLDMLVQLMAVRDAGLDDHPTHAVTLSASGISFHDDSALPVGALVELKLVLFPQYLCIQCFGEVVHCNRSDTLGVPRTYDIGVDFTRIRESDRDLLVQHITRKQSAQLREARIASETGNPPPPQD